MNSNRLVTWIAFLAVFAMAARISVDTDTWWHLRAAQWIIENRQFPQVDEFSYTRYGETWQVPGWLVDIPMYWIYQATGMGGLNLWTATMVTLAFFFVWRTMDGNVFLRACVLVLAAAASGVYWAARPYLVTFVLAGVYLCLLEGYRWKKWVTSPRWLIWLPLLMVVWVNCHGGFIVGFMLWGIYWIAEVGAILWEGLKATGKLPTPRCILTPLFWAGMGMLLAVCVNPYGVSMIAYPFKTVSIGVLRDYIQEWQTPQFHSFSVQPFAWLIFLTFGAVGVSPRRLAFVYFILVALFAYLGLLAGRNVALFAIVTPMVITRHLSPLVDPWLYKRGIFSEAGGSLSKSVRFINCLIFLILLGAVIVKVGMVYPERVNLDAMRKIVPVEAVAFLKDERPPGRLFNSYNWGGYLVWALPEYPVFVDGRTDLYNDAIISEWLKVVRTEPGWQEVLDTYHVNLVLIESSSYLERMLALDSGWRVIYQDALAVIYQRR